MRTLLVVEDFSKEGVEWALEDELKCYGVVALTPMACWELERAGIAYKIPEDYGTWCEAEDEGYQRWFMERWLPLISKESGCPPEVLRCLLTPLRFMVEAFLRRAHQVRWILQAERPDHVLYVVRQGKLIRRVDDDLYAKDGSTFLRAFSGYLPKMGVWSDLGDRTPKPRASWRERLRAPYDAARTLSFVPPWRPMRLCFANVIPGKMREARLRGCHVNVMEELKPDPAVGGPRVFIGPVLLELSNRMGFPFDVCFALAPQLDHFLNVFLPKVENLRRKYKNYLSVGRFNYIIFNRRSKPHHYAAHLAAREIGLKTVYVRHGWSADDAWENRHTRLGSFDYYVAPTEVDRRYYRELGEGLALRCKVI